MTTSDEPTWTVAVSDCARCESDHDQVEFRLLTHPIVAGDYVFTYWAPCPTNGEPIMMQVEDE